MTQTRAEIVEAMARVMHRADRPHDLEWDATSVQTRVAYRVLAEAALDIALRVAAEIAREAERQQEVDYGAANTGGASVAAVSILALTNEGTKP